MPRGSLWSVRRKPIEQEWSQVLDDFLRWLCWPRSPPSNVWFCEENQPVLTLASLTTIYFYKKKQNSILTIKITFSYFYYIFSSYWFLRVFLMYSRYKSFVSYIYHKHLIPRTWILVLALSLTSPWVLEKHCFPFVSCGPVFCTVKVQSF